MESTAKESTKVDCCRIPYANTGYFGKIVLDYLIGADALKPFYNRSPEIASFEGQMQEKQASYTHRAALKTAIQNQYSRAKIKSESIEILGRENTFTITTGHQVCLFTGPLYFIYKIVSAINTCKTLAEKYPDHNFVPVFWMATEDHDFEEANHFYLPSGKIAWENGQSGAVGRMNTTGLNELAAAIKENLGIGYDAGALISLFEQAYVKHSTIADATRFLVHQLFGKYGVVSIDGDDPQLKKLSVEAFRKELLEGLSAKAMIPTNEALADHYDLQVHAREINLFYLDDQLRERIVRREDGNFEVLRTDKVFSEKEILAALETHPERFSPNVILRGLYQEMILPNLAYIGGGGELAYWFQLKGVFETFEVPFPILMLRNSAMVIDRSLGALMKELDLKAEDLFLPITDLENRLVKSHSEIKLNLDESRGKVEAAFLEMENKLKQINPQLERSVGSGYARTDRIIANLEKKMLRAERKKQEIVLGKLDKIRQSLFPRNGLQERNMNFAVLYLGLGADFVDILLDQLQPFDQEFSVLLEKE